MMPNNSSDLFHSVQIRHSQTRAHLCQLSIKIAQISPLTFRSLYLIAWVNSPPEASTNIPNFTQSSYFPSFTFSIPISTALVNSSPKFFLDPSSKCSTISWKWYFSHRNLIMVHVCPRQRKAINLQGKANFSSETRPFLSICKNLYLLVPVFLLWNFNQSIINYLQFLTETGHISFSDFVLYISLMLLCVNYEALNIL